MKVYQKDVLKIKRKGKYLIHLLLAVIILITSWCLMPKMLAVWAADGGVGFTDMSSTGDTDPVWGDRYYRYKDDGDSVVDSDQELRNAIAAATTYAADKPYIIPISKSFELTSAVSITASKNIVLRKVVVQDEAPTSPYAAYYQASNGKYIVQKWWDYNDDYRYKGTYDENGNVTTAPAATPDMYDGEADWKINVSGDYRHFIFGQVTAKFIMENITLDGGGDWDYSYTDPGVGRADKLKGGIDLIKTNITLAANIINCQNAVTTGSVNGGGAIFVKIGTNLTMVGGVLHHNRSAADTGAYTVTGGAICCWDGSSTTTTTDVTVTIGGYTIIEDNYSDSYGGAISVRGGTLTVQDNVIFRRNCANSNGGGAIAQHLGSMTLKDNVIITENESRTITGQKGATVTYPANGGGIQHSGQRSNGGPVTISDNVLISNNIAQRGGGGIAIGCNGTSFLNLNGGKFVGNKALGTYRELAGGASLADQYSIGGGGAIYAFDPKNINIPTNSTVHFEGNTAPFVGYLDNTDLKNGTTGNTFYNGDNYTSHIQNPNVHTSLINIQGSAGADYYNLYNNYDIGTPNNLPNHLFAVTSTSTSPSNVEGGGILRSTSNKVTDIAQDGRTWGEVYRQLTYTATPAPGWRFKSWAATSSVSPLAAEWNTFWGVTSHTAGKGESTSAAITITVQPWDVKLVAIFERDASLSVGKTAFDTLILGKTENPADVSPWIDWQGIAVTNDSGENGKTATITKVELQGDQGKYFELNKTSGGTLAIGQTDSTTWQVRPKQSELNKDTFPLGTPKTYTAKVVFTLSGGTTYSAEVLFHVLKTPTLLIESSHDFGTVVNGSRINPQSVKITNYGVDNCEIKTWQFYQDDDGEIGDVLSTDFEIDTHDVVHVNDHQAITDWQLSPKTDANGKIAFDQTGDYTAWLKITYTGDNLEENETAGEGEAWVKVKVHVTIITPATLDWTTDFKTDSMHELSGTKTIDFNWDSSTSQTLTFTERYAIAPNFIGLHVQNTGDTAATITGGTVTGPGAAAFDLINRGTGLIVPAGSAKSTLSLVPKLGMKAGTYTATLTLEYDDGTGDTKTLTAPVSFTVSNADGWSFNVDADSYTFTSRAEGYAGESIGVFETHDINLKNTGNKETQKLKVTLLDDTDNAFSLETSGVDNIPVGTATSPVTIGLNSGLLASNEAPYRKTYTATLKVSYDLTGIVDTPDPYDEYSQKESVYHLIPIAFTVYRKAPTPNIIIDYETENFGGWENGVSYDVGVEVHGAVQTHVSFTMPEADMSFPLNAVFERIGTTDTYSIRNVDTDEVTTTSDGSLMTFKLTQNGLPSTLDKLEAHMINNGERLFITRLANSGHDEQNSQVLELKVPERIRQPSLTVTDESLDETTHDGKLTNQSMADGRSMAVAGPFETTTPDTADIVWRDVDGDTIDNLSSGIYLVRYKAIAGSAFKSLSLTVEVGAAGQPTYGLNARRVLMGSYTYGQYDNLSTEDVLDLTQPLMMDALGNATVKVTDITLDNSSAFTIIPPNDASPLIPAGAEKWGEAGDKWRICPKKGLDAGSYDTTITVTYTNEAGTIEPRTSSTTLSFAVTPIAIAFKTDSIAFTGKVYDGTTTVEASNMTLPTTADLEGILPADADKVALYTTPVTYAYTTANAGVNHILRDKDYGLTGDKSLNYVLYQPATSFVAEITAKPLTLVLPTFKDKVYDGTTDVTMDAPAGLLGIVESDLVERNAGVSLDWSAVSYAFTSPQVGTNTINKTGLYSLTGDKISNYSFTDDTAETLSGLAQIKQAQPTLVLNATQDNSLVNLTASLPSDATGTLTFYDGDTVIETVTLPQVSISLHLTDEHVFKVVYSGDVNYMTATSNELDYDFNKSDQPPIVFDMAESYVYGDTPTVAFTGGSGTGAVTYDITEGADIASVDAQGRLTLHGLGEFKVTVFKAGDNDYNPTNATSVAIKVLPRPITITGATIAPKTYDGTTAVTLTSVTLSNVLDNLTEGVDYQVSGVFDTPTAGNDKTVIVTVSLSQTDLAKLYQLVNSPYALVHQTIAKAVPDVTIAPLNATVGQRLRDLPLPERFSWSSDAATVLESIGSYTYRVRFTPADSVNYTDREVDVQVNVTAATPSNNSPDSTGNLPDTYLPKTGEEQLPKTGEEQLPKTGEVRTYLISALGCLVIAITIMIRYKRRVETD